MPNWMSYSGEGCSLSFHIPPVFQGLVVWVAHCHYCYYQIIIKNKSNGIQLFKDKLEHPLPKPEGWIRYISRSEMAMEEGYCGDDELELYIYSRLSKPKELAVHIKECGVHVIARKSDSFDESKVGRDTMMSSPPPYHLLPHPHCSSITASTPKQWSHYLFWKLQKHNLHLTIYGKNKYFL
jgi:leucine-rich repeat protein SHOC2